MTDSHINLHFLKRAIPLFGLYMSVHACGIERSSNSVESEIIAQGQTGPSVQYLPLNEPFALVPFPSDSATRFDPNSVTSQRLNFSEDDLTKEGRLIRSHLNELDGFALFAPISLSFEGQLDLATVTARNVKLIELNQSPTQIPLDLGDGFFPLDTPLGWFMGMPPLKEAPNIFFPWSNQVDQLKWNSEADRTAALLKYQRGDEAHLTHYEVESNTLIIRPLVPLKPKQRYAVLLSKAVKGWRETGEYGSIQPPFPSALSTRDQVRLKPLKSQIFKLLSKEELAFGWTFTTGAPMNMLDQVREGLYGRGPLAQLDMPAGFSEIREMDIQLEEPPIRWHERLLPASFLERFSGIVATVTGNSGYAINFDSVDYFVFGSFKSPQLRTEDRLWSIKPGPKGAFQLVEPPQLHSVPFMLSVPKSSVKGEPPFPVVIYFHGTNSSRLEGLILAQELAAQGIALISFDQVGHGPIIRNYRTFDQDNADYGSIISLIPTLIARLIAPHLVEEVQRLSFSEGLDLLSGIGLFRELAVIGRWEDLNQDGYQSEAEGFFDPDPQRLCSSFWQDNVDAMSLVKGLRGLSQRSIPPRIDRPILADNERLLSHMLAGDFNADGILDIGGEGVQISAAGTSLGGIHSLLFSAVEPEVEVVTPIVPGAGMLDILSRTGLRFVSRPMFESYLGQAVVGCPDQGREASEDDPQKWLYISLGDDALRCEKEVLEESALAVIEGDWRGARVHLKNLNTLEETETIIDPRGGFTLHLASDKRDLLELKIYQGEGDHSPAFTKTFHSNVNGRGRVLNTADFRRSAYISNQILERCDPMAFTSRFHPNLVDQERGLVKTLISVALGDQAVPINTSVLLANALGLLGLTEEEWRPRLEELRDHAVLLGLPPDYAWNPEADPEAPLFDVDQLLERDSIDQPQSLGPFPAIEVNDGLSAIRFAHVEGTHEWVAGYEREGFNYGRHTVRQIAAYHRCSGRVIIDQDPWCLQSDECALIDRLYLNPLCQLD